MSTLDTRPILLYILFPKMIMKRARAPQKRWIPERDATSQRQKGTEHDMRAQRTSVPRNTFCEAIVYRTRTTARVGGVKGAHPSPRGTQSTGYIKKSEQAGIAKEVQRARPSSILSSNGPQSSMSRSLDDTLY